MKFALASDIHLEFGPCELVCDPEVRTLVLAGDILVADRITPFGEMGQRYDAFFTKVSMQFDTVLWVAGNHEFYHGKWYKSIEDLRAYAADFGNINFLENNSVIIDDVTFFGATFWTDCKKNDPRTMYVMQSSMNDYRTIRNDQKGYIRISPADSRVRHIESLAELRRTQDTMTTDKMVVISHHAPTFASIDEMYVDDELNGAYASDLSSIMLDDRRIKAWVHGHIHVPKEYPVGEHCTVYSNPRGYYGHQTDSIPHKVKVIEV